MKKIQVAKKKLHLQERIKVLFIFHEKIQRTMEHKRSQPNLGKKLIGPYFETSSLLSFALMSVFGFCRNGIKIVQCVRKKGIEYTGDKYVKSEKIA